MAAVEGPDAHRRHGYDAPRASAPANARLLAAAPELYEALKELATNHRLGCNALLGPFACTCGKFQADRVIAKAEGRAA